MLHKIFKPKKTVAKSYSYYNIDSGSFLDRVLFNDRITATDAANFYRQSSAVATAIDVIAKEIEGIKPVVELDNDILDNTHDVLKLLENPNEFEDYREFIGRLSRFYLLNHDAFVYAEGVTNRVPVNIFAVTNQDVSITQNGRDRYPEIYNVTNGFGSGIYKRTLRQRQIFFYDGNLKEIYHIHGYTSRSDNSFADSPLEAAALDARQQILGRNHNLRIISNGGRLSMAVIVKGETPPTQEQFDEIEQRVNEKFSGSDNAGKIAVFGASDIDIKELGQNNKDMDFSLLDRTSSNAIYMRYGVPLPLVSADRQTFNNFDRAIEDFYDRSVLPYTNILFSGLTKMLRRRYDNSFKRITYNPESILALKGRMMNEIKIRRDINIETVNELREGLPNREPIEGGDIFYQPATLIPVGEDIFQEEKVDSQNVIADETT